LGLAVPDVPKHRRVLGDNIRKQRNRSGLSQEKLAEKADLHPVYLSTVERGVKTISFDALVRIAKALGIGLSDLCRGCLPGKSRDPKRR
jgi:XRE family transcriptional regulator, regulator of sulfur utilization